MFNNPEEIIEYIYSQLIIGRSLIAICKDKDVPSRATINKWVAENEEFKTRIARAREEQADYYLDKQIEYIDEATVENYQLKKFQADQLKWVAAKLNQKKYGDKQSVDVAHTLTLADLVQKSYQKQTTIDVTPSNELITQDVPKSQSNDTQEPTD